MGAPSVAEKQSGDEEWAAIGEEKGTQGKGGLNSGAEATPLGPGERGQV